jgi:hypothetical protein
LFQQDGSGRSRLVAQGAYDVGQTLSVSGGGT